MTGAGRRLTASFSRGSFARNVAVLTMGTVAGQALLALSSPLLTRLYNPDQLGAYAIFTAFVNFASVGLTLRYEAGLVNTATRRNAAYLMAICLGLVPLLSLVSLGLLLLLGRQNLLGLQLLLGPFTLPVLFALVATGAFSAMKFWFIRNDEYGSVARLSVYQGAVRAVAQVLLGFTPFGWAGLVWGDLVGRFAGIGRMAGRVLPQLRAELKPFDPAQVKAELKEHRKFPIYSLPSSLLDSLSLTVLAPLIAQFYGVVAAGYFALVDRVLSLPLTAIGANFADVFHRRFALCYQESPQQMRPLFLRTSLVLLAMGVGPCLLLAVAGGPLFGFVFGDEWRAAGSLAAVMSVWALFRFVVSPLSRVVFVLSGQEQKLAYDTVRLAAILAAMFIGNAQNWSLFRTIALLSVAEALSYVLYWFVLYRMIRRAEVAS